MEKIQKNFSVLFEDEQSPYFQADKAQRFSFSFQQLKGKGTLQRCFVEFLFAGNSQIDLTFLQSYAASNSNHFSSFGKKSLYQAIRIQNWREQIVVNQENKTRFIFVTVQNIAALEVLAYIKSIARGKPSSFIGFYNDRHLLTVDDDECVVISRNREDSNAVRKFIEETDEERSLWQKSILA